MDRTIFFDFDGTIVCNKARLYNFFLNNIPLEYKNSLSIKDFWSIKRMGINEIDWINKIYKVNLCVAQWNKIKKREIESNNYLSFNKLFPFSHDTLKVLSKTNRMILVTRRSNKDNLINELKMNNIEKYFSDILVVPHKGNNCKSQSIFDRYNPSKNDIFVGDTEDDIRAGISLGIETYFVNSGIRSSWIIERFFSLKSREIKVIEDIRSLHK